MGHPPSVVRLPTGDYPLLAAAVERIAAAHGGSPAELAALLRPGVASSANDGQLAALAWVLDVPRRHVLLVRHPVLGWSCPGGHVDVGEEPVATATRELREETGLSLDPVSPDPVTLSRDAMPADDHGPWHVHWSLGFLFAGDPTAPLTAERDRPAAWFPITELPVGAVADLAPLLAGLLDLGARRPRSGTQRAQKAE